MFHRIIKRWVFVSFVYVLNEMVANYLLKKTILKLSLLVSALRDRDCSYRVVKIIANSHVVVALDGSQQQELLFLL